MTKPARAVFLDRDGVLNRAFVDGGKSRSPRTLDEFELLPGVVEALHALKAAGVLLIVATNQPEVAQGLQRREVVEAMHARLREQLPLDGIKVCYEADEANCPCRKPKPGLLFEAAREHTIDLARSFVVGDRWRDVGAGRAAGCFTIFIDRGYDEALRDAPDAICGDLPGAAEVILRHLNSPSPVGDLR